MIKIGDIFYKRVGPNMWYKCHIIEIIEDEDALEGKLVVFKWYGKHKQWWHFETESIYFFNDKIKTNILYKRRLN